MKMGRDWRDASTNQGHQGLPAKPEAGKGGKDHPLEPSATPHLHLRLLASRAGQGRLPVAFSTPPLLMAFCDLKTPRSRTAPPPKKPLLVDAACLPAVPFAVSLGRSAPGRPVPHLCPLHLADLFPSPSNLPMTGAEQMLMWERHTCFLGNNPGGRGRFSPQSVKHPETGQKPPSQEPASVRTRAGPLLLM